jgi:hypothetical protein
MAFVVAAGRFDGALLVDGVCCVTRLGASGLYGRIMNNSHDVNADSVKPVAVWNPVSNPILPSESIPAERRVVLVWLRGHALPFCGYIRYAAGDRSSPYFVVYHGNSEIGSDVVAWCDCLPSNGPDIDAAKMYTKEQEKGRGFAARKSRSRCDGSS